MKRSNETIKMLQLLQTSLGTVWYFLNSTTFNYVIKIHEENILHHQLLQGVFRYIFLKLPVSNQIADKSHKKKFTNV